MPVSLNQCHGEIGSFHNQLTSQITELTISLFNIVLKITKNLFSFCYLYNKNDFVIVCISISNLQNYIYMEFHNTFILF